MSKKHTCPTPHLQHTCFCCDAFDICYKMEIDYIEQSLTPLQQQELIAMYNTDNKD